MNDKAQRTAQLTAHEQERQTYLLEHYQQAVLRHTLCLEILQRRGYAVRIIGLTATGRATIHTLDMNNVRIVKSRFLCVRAGWHPLIS